MSDQPRQHNLPARGASGGGIKLDGCSGTLEHFINAQAEYQEAWQRGQRHAKLSRSVIDFDDVHQPYDRKRRLEARVVDHARRALGAAMIVPRPDRRAGPFEPPAASL